MSGTPEKFLIKLDKTTVKGKTIKLQHISIPNTMYNINSTNNYIDILELANEHKFSVCLPKGYYEAHKLDSHVEVLLTLESSLGPNKIRYNCIY